MTDRKLRPSGQPAGDAGRRHRQAEALRRNLLRRKAQARARRTALPAAPRGDAERS